MAGEYSDLSGKIMRVDEKEVAVHIGSQDFVENRITGIGAVRVLVCVGEDCAWKPPQCHWLRGKVSGRMDNCP